MKVNAHHPQDTHGAAVRMVAKARSGHQASADVAAPAPAPAQAGSSTAPAGTAASAPVESTVEMAARQSPPGLLRVAARLEAMGAEGRTSGQSNALAQITRNLQRYVDTQGAQTAPAPAPAVAAPAATESSADMAAAEISAEPTEPTRA